MGGIGLVCDGQRFGVVLVINGWLEVISGGLGDIRLCLW